jgi:hypothetical protein
MEVHIGHDLAVHQRHDARHIARLQGLVGLDGVEHVGGQAQDHGICGLIGGQRRGEGQNHSAGSHTGQQTIEYTTVHEKSFRLKQSQPCL